LTQKYSQIIASFSSSKKQTILENVNTLLAKYTKNVDETNKKTLQNIALLNAVKEILTTTQTAIQNNEKLLL
jgi:DNA-binding protein Fis